MLDYILTHYSSSKALGIVCDASSYGVGALLFHIEKDKTEKPILFVSATLSFYGMHVSLFSDHKPLEFIFGEKKMNTISGARIQRWSLLLSQYDSKISY